jgi:DNA-binding CsgD family transcriptional regulator
VTFTGPPPLVGRPAQVRSLTWALDEVAAGRGLTVALTGDPGIGKTRLLTEITGQAAGRGVAVLSGNATEFERDLPFQVFIDALADRYRAPAAEPIPDGPDAEAPQRLDELFSGRGTPGSGAERFRAYGAVRALLVHWARPGLVLTLDDMHWADPGALELAEFLVRRPPAAPLLIVLAMRSRQEPAGLAGALARGVDLGTVLRIDLGPLSAEESAVLAGPGLDEPTAKAIYEESGGNPLYLLALATARRNAATRHSAADRMDAVPGDAPNRLEALMLAELTGLTRRQQLVTSAAAVVGEQIRMDVLPAVTGLSPAEVAAEVAELARRDVLRPAGDAGTALAFRHPVFRRAVYRKADPAWRAAAHRRALAELTRRAAPAAELAHHVAASPAAREPGDLEILQAAALGAMNSAPASAAHWLRVALDGLPDDQAHAGQRLEILLRLTRALGVAGRLSESRDLLHEILHLVPRRPPGPRIAAVTFCATMERLLARYPEGRAMLAAELAAPDAWASGEAIALAVEYGGAAVLSADYPSARGQVNVAVAAARRRQDPVREVNALTISALGEVYEGDIVAATAAADAATALADGLPDRVLSDDVECLSRLGWAEVFLERFEDANRHFVRGEKITRHIGQYHVLPHALLGQCQVAAWQGALSRAIALSEDAEEIARHIGCDDVLGMALALRSFAVTWTDAPGQGENSVELAQQAAALIPQASVWWRQVAGIYLAFALLLNGHPARSMESLLATGGGPGLPLIQPSKRPSCLDMLTAAAALSGDNAAARDASHRSDAESRKLGLPGERGFAVRSRGLMLSIAGKHDSALAEYRSSYDLINAAGMRVSAGLSLVLGAQSAIDAGREEVALAMVDEARALARASGAGMILAMVEGMRLRPGVADPAKAPGSLAALSRREQEVARLAATGQTSQQIAAQLSLSPRTVETHLARIYRKLGLSSRTALAALIAAEANGSSRRSPGTRAS